MVLILRNRISAICLVVSSCEIIRRTSPIRGGAEIRLPQPLQGVEGSQQRLSTNDGPPPKIDDESTGLDPQPFIEDLRSVDGILDVIVIPGVG